MYARQRYPPAAAGAVMRHTILRISDSKTLELILEFEKEQCLWNTNLVDYPNRQERIKAYERIATKLDIPNFTAHHVMIKLKNLRNSYCQDMKRILADEDYRPKVFWFRHMDRFLRAHVQNTKIKSYTARTESLQESNEDVENDECTNVEYQSMQIKTDDEEILSPDVKRRKLSTEWINTKQSEIKQVDSDVEEISNELHKYDEPTTGISATILEINEEGLTADEITKPPDEDHYETFGNYIASLMKLLPPKKALLLEPKIIDMIVSASVETLGDDNF